MIGTADGLAEFSGCGLQQPLLLDWRCRSRSLRGRMFTETAARFAIEQNAAHDQKISTVLMVR
jgi:hypothetical protein